MPSLGDNYELSFSDRSQAIYPKEMLIEPVKAPAQTTPKGHLQERLTVPSR
jgi:hypothetical protein